MFNLFLRSLLVLALLFGLLFAIGMVIVVYSGASVWVAVAFALGIVFLQYLFGPSLIQLLFSINWQPVETIEPSMADFFNHVCADHNIPQPRFGVIDDGNPNAFTFGHYPGDARIVVTTGLLEKLNQEELEAVIAHEFGHIAHWDFVVITIASAIPLIMYIIWLYGRRFTSGSSRSGGIAGLIALSAFVAYLLSQFIVLLLSRVREYYADEFSAKVTGNPRALTTALVKIAYGLAASDKSEKKNQSDLRMDGMKAIGIFDTKVAQTLALASAANGTPSLSGLEEAMKWDLWNPWAFIYELKSTHPLPAKRIRALGKSSSSATGPISFGENRFRPESYWDEFFVDLFVNYLPFLAFFLSIGGIVIMGSRFYSLFGIGMIMSLTGIAWWLKRRFTYRHSFENKRLVRSLVGEVKVSAVRSIPCTLEGEIIGRGVPGLFYSEDLVLQDESGFILVDYRQPLKILEFLFGWVKADQLIGRKANITGWYRRSPRPYLEMRKASFSDGTLVTSYLYPFRQFLVYALLALGIFFMIIGA